MSSSRTVAVRPLREGDRADLEAIADRAFSRTERVSFDPDKGHTLVATADGDVVGGAVLRTVDLGDRRVGFTDWVFADPEQGVPGTGSALRDAAIEYFEAAGVDETVARIASVNSASQELHRRGGYAPLPFRQQVRRWGRRLPRVYLASHGLTDAGLRMWVRGADPAPASLVSRLAATWWINVLLLAVVTLRAPRQIATLGSALVWLPLIAFVLLGLREATLRVVARDRGLSLGHAPWIGGVAGVGLPVGVIFGAWAPMFGSSAPDAPGWRYERDLQALALAHVGAGVAVAVVAWVTVLWDPGAELLGAQLPWADIRRAATTFALLDLVPFARVYGNAGRVIHDHSSRWWIAMAVIGGGPMVLTVGGLAA